MSETEIDLLEPLHFCLELVNKYRVERRLDNFGEGYQPW